MPESRKTFADWMRSGEALNLPGGAPPPENAPEDGADFYLPPDDAGGEERYFQMRLCRKDGVDERRLRDIARGKAAVEDEIDLHGCTAEEAREHLEMFMRRALSSGARVVEVVHGRGLRAEDGKGVLKAKTRKWLARSDAVLGFIEPRGNGGSVRVLLRKRGKTGA